MSARKSLLIPFLLFSVITSRAQQASTPADFSAGFKQLAALGLPPLDAQAQWSALPEAANSGYETREILKAVKGNAWLLPSPDDKPLAVAMGGVETLEIKAAKKRPAELDLTKDVEAILAAFKKLTAKLEAEDRDPFRYSSSGSSFGSFLLFATQLHQTGHPALANQLALAVFGMFPSREAAVDAAIDLLASHLYQEASRAFFASGDWAAYHTALAALCKRFPRGWSCRDAVAIFLPQLEKQAAGTKAPAPSLPDHPIDPRALAIIRDLTEKPPVDPNQPDAKDKKSRALTAAMRYRMQYAQYEGYGGDRFSVRPLWLISESADAADADAKASPLARLAELKMAAIPALAALAADSFLTHLPNPRSSSGYSGYFPSGESADERTLRLYESLNRPATRGEIATQLLKATLPESDEDERNPADPETVRETALAFWKDHKDASREELAAIFLRDGSNSQAAQAAAILATSTDPKAHQAFETHVLAADPAIDSFRDVQAYLRTRKAAARPFFDAYAKLVRSQIKDAAGDSERSGRNEYAIKEAGGPEKILKQLEALLGGQSPRALAVQIAKGKPADAKAAINSLSSLLEDATPTKHLHALLEGANAATDPVIRARFLQATYNIRWDNDESETETEPKADAPPPDRKVAEAEANVWRKLIADTTSIPSEFNPQNRFRQVNTSDKTTVADLAAIAFETTINPDCYMNAGRAALILNKTVSAILVEQATARLADKPVPPLPDADKISKDRLAEIVAAAGKKPAAEIHPYLATLTPDERAAWLDWLNDPGDLAIPDSVKELQFTITARSSDSFLGLPVAKDAGNLDLGFKITADSLTKHIEALAPEIDKHSRAFIVITSADFGPGLEISAGIVPLPTQNAGRRPKPDELDAPEKDPTLGARIFSQAIKTLDANEAASAFALVGLQGEQARGQTVWLIRDGKATPQQPDAADDDAKDPFAPALKSLLESAEPQRFRFFIEIITRADAGKFKAAAEEPAAPSEDSPTPTEDEEE